MNKKNIKLKIPSEDRSFNMDRGGVKPLEQTDKTAPENRSDSALVHDDNNINVYINRKAPLRELFGVTNDLDHSRLANLVPIISNP
ncbi:hypothetical protein A2819_02320 [Candidatus Azambacteria bacterium RIFCSPHIGHO2_01_FULL_40_24]|uniref:Uncharacterized protein n=1 Tax=Candidatus Azambacteria bacterium RIFCSPHIGHO2_01_FULL_40_24 TaxID=1797301 RepID=A0A1F5B563_9BACT|nr:MAG: hypothetical protein A2819_02320 [Candidatus Azambacteria bacterium RIFCSPHIGHO2_01_FULL_40_24]